MTASTLTQDIVVHGAPLIAHRYPNAAASKRDFWRLESHLEGTHTSTFHFQLHGVDYIACVADLQRDVERAAKCFAEGEFVELPGELKLELLGRRARFAPCGSQTSRYRFGEKVGRNDPCPCGCGLKSKRCQRFAAGS
jgi:hypothetical protein